MKYIRRNGPRRRWLRLSKGRVTLVDDADYEWLNQWKWHCSNGYAVRTECNPKPMKNRMIRMHRVIAQTPEDMYTDHINGNKLDNRRENLRICTRSQNQLNRSADRGRLYKGTQKIGNRWMAKIVFNKKTYYIGLFKTEEDAAEAYNYRALELHGSFAKLNKIGDNNAV